VIPPTAPGQRCRVIGSRRAFNGHGKSQTIGRIVVTVFLHKEVAGPQAEQEPVWRCRSEDGKPLQTYDFEAMEVDFLECWLERLPPEQTPPAATTTEKEVSA
jgi:hypothetical protein